MNEAAMTLLGVGIIFHIIFMLLIAWILTQEGEDGEKPAAVWFPDEEDAWKRVAFVVIHIVGGLATAAFYFTWLAVWPRMRVAGRAVCHPVKWLKLKALGYAQATGIIRKE